MGGKGVSAARDRGRVPRYRFVSSDAAWDDATRARVGRERSSTHEPGWMDRTWGDAFPERSRALLTRHRHHRAEHPVVPKRSTASDALLELQAHRFAVSSGMVHASAKEAENALAARLPMKLFRWPEEGGDMVTGRVVLAARAAR